MINTLDSKMDVAIVSAKRTPIGSLLGNLSTVSAPELGSTAIGAALIESNVEASDIDEVVMGNVLGAGLGQAPARQAAIGARLPSSVRCSTINKVCGSGMKAIANTCNSIQLGQSQVAVAGGMESMSLAPFLINSMRGGNKFGHTNIIDHMQFDGLQDAYQGVAMGSFAENCAERFQFGRSEQDEYAIESLKRAKYSVENMLFKDEICEVTVKTKKSLKVISLDEQPLKADVNKIGDLKPAFKENGTLTAANSSSISDGAAALLLCDSSFAASKKIAPLAWIRGISEFSQESEWFTLSPIGAIQDLVSKLDWALSDIGLWEINEAFAVVPMATMRELNIHHSKVNVRGGACALGHPIGASGARIVVTLVHAMMKESCGKGIASICIGGGEAMAIAIELND